MRQLFLLGYSLSLIFCSFGFCTKECDGKGFVSVLNNSAYTVTVYLDGSRYMTIAPKKNAPVEMDPGTHELEATANINSTIVSTGINTVNVTECMMDTWTLNLQ
jgi:hypothetical protein